MNLIPKFLRKTETKSANGNQDYYTVGSGCLYMSASTATSPYDLLAQNKNFPYACANKIAQYIASVPIHLYTYSNNTKSMILTNRKVNKSFKKEVNKIIQKPILTKAMDMTEIVDESPLLDFILHPAENMSYPEWISLITQYILIMGNCLLEIVKEGKTIKYLNILKWEDINIDIIDGKITKYQYTPSNDKYRTLLPEQVIHLKQLAPGSNIVGVGNLEKCIDSATLYSYSDAYQQTLCKNYGMPGVNINVKSKIGNVEEAKKIAMDFQNRFSKQGNGKPIVTFGSDIDIKSINVPPKDMEYQGMREWSKKTICAIFGVPEDLVDTSDSNRASSLTAIDQFYQMTIFPLLNKILEELNTNFVEKYFDENSFYFYDKVEVLSDDQETQSRILNSYVTTGILSVAEARNRLGLDIQEE